MARAKVWNDGCSYEIDLDDGMTPMQALMVAGAEDEEYEDDDLKVLREPKTTLMFDPEE